MRPPLVRQLLRGFVFILILLPAGQDQARAEASPGQIINTGEPLTIPLQCRSEDLMRAGLVCNQDSPCRLFLELLAVAQAGSKVYAVGDVHSAAATVSSLLLVSEDQGKTWTEPEGRMPGVGFERIQFVDDDHGWIGGQEWDIDTTSRPFLLATVNGGRRWDRWNVWDNFDERRGAILDFYFDSPKHGFLIVDRLISEGDSYELYESMTGGRSWSIRQATAERPSISRGLLGASSPLWRLQEDAANGLYEIQQNQGGQWTTVARFSNRVGVCRSMDTGEKKVTEADTPTEEQPSEEAETAEPSTDSGVFVIPSRRD